MASNNAERQSLQTPPEYRFFSGNIGFTPNLKGGEQANLNKAFVLLTLKDRPDLPHNFDLRQHPDFTAALRQLIDEWGDKDSKWRTRDGRKLRWDEFPVAEKPTAPPDEVNLYSSGKLIAYVIFPESFSSRSPELSVSVDLHKHANKSDENFSNFEQLMLKYLSYQAGRRVREAGSGEYVFPEFSEKIEPGTYPQSVIDSLSGDWPGEQEVFFLTSQNGTQQWRRLGSFDSLDNEDKNLRLSIVSIEKFLIQDKERVAILRTNYLDTNNAQYEGRDDAPPAESVFTPLELIVVGNSVEEYQRHLHTMTELLESQTSRYVDEQLARHYELAVRHLFVPQMPLDTGHEFKTTDRIPGD